LRLIPKAPAEPREATKSVRIVRDVFIFLLAKIAHEKHEAFVMDTTRALYPEQMRHGRMLPCEFLS
jgi:hypothetical protein